MECPSSFSPSKRRVLGSFLFFVILSIGGLHVVSAHVSAEHPNQTIPPFTPMPTTPTATPTTPTATPTTPTATPTATMLSILSVMPNRASSTTAADLYVLGEGFVTGAVASLQQGATNTVLPTQLQSSRYLLARAPAGLAPGAYDVTVTLPGGASATAAAAYTVLSDQNDDLFGFGYELWSSAMTLRVGEEVDFGLMVHRSGGKAPLANVTVRFSLDAPDDAVLGNGVIPLLSPRAVESTSSVAWTPPAEGQYIVYATIDPDQAINEDIESNNVVSRTLAVNPANLDTTPPIIDQFTLDGGAHDSLDLSVDVTVQASDPAPGSGVQFVFVREYLYSQAAEHWLPIQESGWLPYAGVQRAELAWTLFATPGARFFMAWVIDSAGNVSAPVRALINYRPEEDTLGLEQVRTYRYLLKPSQPVSVTLEPRSGDPDLYVWPPDYATRPPWISVEPAGIVDTVALMTPVGGIYQMDIHGFIASDYRLQVAIDSPQQRATTRTTWDAAAETKPARTRPLISLARDPDVLRHTPPAAPPVTIADFSLHLPIVGR